MKTYKGIELFKAVANYELKCGTKLKCTHYPTYGQGIEVAENKPILIWSDTKEPIGYTHFDDRDFEFEIIEEEKPKKIEELKIKNIYKCDDYQQIYINFKETWNKINEIIDYLLEKESDK